jgi:hypothetical protein
VVPALVKYSTIPPVLAVFRTFARNLRAPHLAYREDPERVRLTRLFDQPACPVPIASRIVREAST